MLLDTAASTLEMFSGSAAGPSALLKWQHGPGHSLGSSQLIILPNNS